MQPVAAEGSSKKKKRSLGRQCAAYGCYNTFYNTDGNPSGLHFFRFPQKNPDKLRWCNFIKRIDGMDGFKVTSSTVLCEKHFTDADMKRNPGHWRQWRTGRDAKLRSQPGPAQVLNNRALCRYIRGNNSVVFQDIYVQENIGHRKEDKIIRKKTFKHCLGFIIRLRLQLPELF